MEKKNPSVFDNKLLMQYLSAAGQDIMGGGPIGANTNQVTQQNIKTQNYAKVLQAMLTGGGKLTMDKDNINIKAPMNVLQPQKENNSQGMNYQPNFAPNFGDLNIDPINFDQKSTPSAQKGGGTPDLMQQLLMGYDNVNPSHSPLGDLSPSDLAGLTPQDLTSIMQYHLTGQATNRQNRNDAFNNIYKLAMIKQAEAQTKIAQIKETREWSRLMAKSPLEVPGIGKVPEDVWNELPNEVKAYAYYAFDTQQRGEEEVSSFMEWKAESTQSSMNETVRLAMEDPEFKKAYIALKNAGATRISIGEKLAGERARGELKAEQYFTVAGGLAKDIENYIASEDVQNELFKYVSEGDFIYKKEKAKVAAIYIRQQIISRLGPNAILSEAIDPKTGIGTWRVRFKNNKVGTVSHVIYN